MEGLLSLGVNRNMRVRSVRKVNASDRQVNASECDWDGKLGSTPADLSLERLSLIHI